MLVASVSVRIAQISFHREVLPETMKLKGLYIGGVTHAPESGPGGKGNRAVAGKNLGRVVQKNLIHYARSEGSPIHHRAAFDERTGNFLFTQTARDTWHIGTSIGQHRRNLLHANTERLERLFLLLFSERAEHQDIVFRGLDDARTMGQAQP